MAGRLTLLDIPPEFQYESERLPFPASVHRYIVGICQELNILDSPSGLLLVQAGFHLRYGIMAKELRENAFDLQNTLKTEAQMTALGAFQLVLVSCAAVLDLGAAALTGLAGHDLAKRRTPDLRDVAQKRRKELPTLPANHARWVDRTHQESVWLFQIRDAVVHRHVPVSVTVGAQEPYYLTVKGRNAPIQASIDEFLDLSVDRLLTLLRMLRTRH